MFDRKTIDEASKVAQTLPVALGAMRTDLSRQTVLLQRMMELQERQDARVRPVPIFLDLTLGQPSIDIGDTIEIVDGFMSGNGPQIFTFHIGEGGTFFTHWYIGGLDRILPFAETYPLTLPRGVRLWIEELNRPATDFWMKLIAFPVRTAEQPH